MIPSGAALNSTAINGLSDRTVYGAVASSQCQGASTQASFAVSGQAASSQAQDAQGSASLATSAAEASGQAQGSQAIATPTLHLSSVSDQGLSTQSALSRDVLSAYSVNTVSWSALNSVMLNGAVDCPMSSQVQEASAQVARAASGASASSQAQEAQVLTSLVASAAHASGQSAQSSLAFADRSHLIQANSTQAQSEQAALDRVVSTATDDPPSQAQSASVQAQSSIQAQLAASQLQSCEASSYRLLNAQTASTQAIQSALSSLDRAVHVMDTQNAAPWSALNGIALNSAKDFQAASQAQKASGQAELGVSAMSEASQAQQGQGLFGLDAFASSTSWQAQKASAFSDRTRIAKSNSSQAQSCQAVFGRTVFGEVLTWIHSGFALNTSGFNSQVEVDGISQAQSAYAQTTRTISSQTATAQAQDGVATMIRSLYAEIKSGSGARQTASAETIREFFVAADSIQAQQLYAEVIRLSGLPSSMYVLVPPAQNIAYAHSAA